MEFREEKHGKVKKALKGIIEKAEAICEFLEEESYGREPYGHEDYGREKKYDEDRPRYSRYM